jgi:hypothetical protein
MPVDPPQKIKSRHTTKLPPFNSEVLETLHVRAKTVTGFLGFLSTTDVQSGVVHRRRIPTRMIRWRFLVCFRTDRGKADARA